MLDYQVPIYMAIGYISHLTLLYSAHLALEKDRMELDYCRELSKQHQMLQEEVMIFGGEGSCRR